MAESGEPTPRGDRGRQRRRAAHSGSHADLQLPGPERADRLARRPQGGEPPANRVVQDPRRVGEAGGTRRRSLARNRRRLSGQPRTSGCVRGARGGRAVRGLHAGGGLDLEGGRDHRLRRVGASRGRLARRLCPPRARHAPGRPAFISSTPSTTRRSWRAKEHSASSWFEDVEDLAMVIVPLGGGGLVSGVACAIDALGSARQGRRGAGGRLRALPGGDGGRRARDGHGRARLWPTGSP